MLLLRSQAQAEAESAAEALQIRLDKLMEGKLEALKEPKSEGVRLTERVPSEEVGPRYVRTVSNLQVEDTKSLLERVSVLRKEKMAVLDALEKAEKELSERLQRENVMFGNGEAPSEKEDPGDLGVASFPRIAPKRH